jgi:hypothetical protein
VAGVWAGSRSLAMPSSGGARGGPPPPPPLVSAPARHQPRAHEVIIAALSSDFGAGCGTYFDYPFAESPLLCSALLCNASSIL